MSERQWNLGSLVKEYGLVLMEMETYRKLDLKVPDSLCEKQLHLEEAIDKKLEDVKQQEIAFLEEKAEALKPQDIRREEIKSKLEELLDPNEFRLL
jgi:ABC-type phosphate transport system auxiliary subunit